MDGRMRYRLQRKEQKVMPNVLGNRSFPVYTYCWRDVAMSDDLDALKEMIPDGSKNYRIEDTGGEEVGSETQTL